MGEWSPDVESLVADVLIKHRVRIEDASGWVWHCECFWSFSPMRPRLPRPAPQKLHSEAVALAAAHQALEVCTALAAAGVLANEQ